MRSVETVQSRCFFEADPDCSLFRRAFAELMGTFLLVLVLAGAKLNAFQVSGWIGDSSVLTCAIAAGAALAGLIFAFGAVSGGHFNPLITVLQMIFRERSSKCTLAYVIAQFAGAVGGAYSAFLALGPADGRRGPPSQGYAWMFAEFIASAGLMLVVFGCMRSGRKEFGSLGVGIWLTALSIALPGTAANPAVAIGMAAAFPFEAVVARPLPLSWLMELTGALLAGGVLFILFPRDKAAAASLSATEGVANQSAD